MVRHVALFAVSLALLVGCGNLEEYPSHEEGPKEKAAAPIPKVEEQPAKPVHSSDGSAEKRLLESLPKDDQYLIVTGDALGQVSKELNGRLLRIDAILVWLSPGAEAGMSTFETRDGRFEFEVSWGELNSWDDAEEIMRIKERIHESHYESKFRLYGRWEHEDSLFHTYRVLNIDKWKIVEW
jgi:hypothetical protein